ncbi:MAG: 6-phosphogluconolactonase [Verrucomicrobiales bacterium]|jgi:6-phosphogluconolactonase|nr:6-phosphogluconolactonase [Verrucomicrobiales bacterium]
MNITHLRFDRESDWLAALTVNWRRLGSEALHRRGVFNVALSGGATPGNFYRVLGRADWAWSATQLFISDERWVPTAHQDSNHRMIYEAFYPLTLNLERWKTELPKAGDAAADYERRLIRALGQPPRFDLILLDVGADGHTAALFPGTRALTVRDRYAVANWVPQLGAQRLTLTYATLNQAGEIWFLARGGEKQPWLQRMEQGASPDFPAAAVTTERGEIKIFNCVG